MTSIRSDMWFKEKPADFKKRYNIVGCFVEYDGKFILLHRLPQKANGDKWGLPAGKMEAGESLKQAILREVKEETGLELPESSVEYFDSRFVRHGDFDFEWHMFSTKLNALPGVTVNPHEHSEFRWVTPDEATQMNVIGDLSESIKLFYKL